MKHMKTIEVPATTREVVDFVACELCKEKIKEHPPDVDETKIAHKKGYIYPEYASGTETSVDMCGKCFEEKLVPWLRSQGAEPITEDWEW